MSTRYDPMQYVPRIHNIQTYRGKTIYQLQISSLYHHRTCPRYCRTGLQSQGDTNFHGLRLISLATVVANSSKLLGHCGRSLGYQGHAVKRQGPPVADWRIFAIWHSCDYSGCRVESAFKFHHASRIRSLTLNVPLLSFIFLTLSLSSSNFRTNSPARSFLFSLDWNL